MFRSMFSAISGLRNHQLYMDVIGNNIANVNTTGFKGSRVAFQDLLSQTLRGAITPGQVAPSGGRGGINALQVGLGAVTGTTDTIQTQGILQSTNKPTDFAIQGDGYYILTDGVKKFYTRDGNFDIAGDGTLISPANGYRVLGWMADKLEKVDHTANPAPIVIRVGQTVITKGTARVEFAGNLNSSAPKYDPTSEATKAATKDGLWKTGILTYDSLGVPHNLLITFTKTASNEWQWQVTAEETAVQLGGDTSGTLRFKPTGEINTATTTPVLPKLQVLDFGNGSLPATSDNPDDVTNGVAGLKITLDMNTMQQLNQVNSAGVSLQDGYTSGTLQSFAVADTGEIQGTFSNGQSKLLGQFALSTFPNPGGLQKLGNNLYFESANSGLAQIGAPRTGNRGTVQMGMLEGSNVDLAQQFTQMIIAQRGFQSNSRIITTSDEMLQELVNLKR